MRCSNGLTGIAVVLARFVGVLRKLVRERNPANPSGRGRRLATFFQTPPITERLPLKKAHDAASKKRAIATSSWPTAAIPERSSCLLGMLLRSLRKDGRLREAQAVAISIVFRLLLAVRFQPRVPLW